MAKLRIDWRFIEIEHEMSMLGDYLPTIAPALAKTIADDREGTASLTSGAGIEADDSELQQAWQEHTWRVTQVFPRFVRGPFVIALCAAYEAGVKEVANDVRRTKGFSLSLSDIRADNFIKSANKYLLAAAQHPLDDDPARLQRIGDLFSVRHLLAHANGDLRRLDDKTEKQVASLTKQYPELHVVDRWLIPSQAFLDAAYADVSSSMKALVYRVRGGPSVIVVKAPI
jgi:hypothetical protein